MRRFLLLLPIVLLAVSAARAETGETKEFKDKNFKWTLPGKGWAFVEPSAEEKHDSYVVVAELTGQNVKAHARVVDRGPTAEEIAKEVSKTFGVDLAKTAKNETSSATLSGLPGTVVVLQGTATSGGTLWMRAYAANEGGVLYQLIVQAYNGAEAEHLEAIDALKRGFRLLKGAGGAEAPEKLEAGAPADEAPAPADGSKGGGGGFPAGGPKLEGRTVVFPSHNLRWKLPEGSPFAWEEPADDETIKQGKLISARASVARPEPKKGEPPLEGPRTNLSLVSLHVQPRAIGDTLNGFVNNKANQDLMKRKFFGGKVDETRTKVDLDRKVGNTTGASFTLGSVEAGTVRDFTFLVVMLKGEIYLFEVMLLGGKDVRSSFGQALSGLLGGVEFIDTKEAVQGPLGVDAVSAHNAPRGRDADKEDDLTFPGFTGKKPKGLAELEFNAGDRQMRAAYEARSDDGQAYFYFDVHAYDAALMMRNKRGPEDIVKEREGEWKTKAGDKTVTITKGKTPWFDATFSGEKGLGYHFTGTHGEYPFVEQGWVFKAGGNYIWVRLQFGGKDAEKTMEPFAKAVKRLKPI